MMHSSAELNRAATAAVSAALAAAGKSVPMLAREVYEELPRPSAKILVGKITLEAVNAAAYRRTAELAAVWNAPDIYTYKLDCLDAADTISAALASSGIRLADGQTLYPDDGRITTEIIDAAVILRFTLTDTGTLDTEDGDAEVMEKLAGEYDFT